ncbi:MAG: hypothetical protein QM731_15970 [Chitinophagaceae bacterium]
MDLKKVYRHCVPMARSIVVYLAGWLPGLTAESVTAWFSMLPGKKGSKKKPVRKLRSNKNNQQDIRIYTSFISANNR